MDMDIDIDIDIIILISTKTGDHSGCPPRFGCSLSCSLQLLGCPYNVFCQIEALSLESSKVDKISVDNIKEYIS
jgi:hypothetical protein